MAPYNQGDFQARAYVGGGFMSMVQNRLKLQETFNGIPGAESFTIAWKRDAPGYYGEVGVHMFFATRFSVLLGAVYRGAKVEAVLDRDFQPTGEPPDFNKPLGLDLSGVGGRMAVAVGF